MFYTACQVLSSIALWKLFKADQDFDITLPQAESAKEGIVHGSIDWNLRMSFFEEGGTDVGEQDNKQQNLY